MHRKLSALLALILIFAVAAAAPALAFTPNDYDAANPSQLTADMLYSQAAVLIDADSGNVLFSKNERDRMNPASTTKIMTLLLGIESGIPLDQEIAIPQAAADIPGDSSIIPVYPGDTMTFGDLLLGFMIASGNDGANAVAVLVSGSVESFVERMNQRAAEIGCTGTHFANAHGYTNENHYTTAYDLALIARTAMQNETFRQIVNNYRATVTVSGRGELNLMSKYEIMKPTSAFYYADCIGIKTGTTSAAGDCFVGAAERDGATLISVDLKAEKTENKEYNWADTTRLFDYGWTCYDTYTLDQMFEVAEGQIVSCVVSNASKDDPYGGRLDLEIAQISDTSYLRMVERNSATALGEAVNDFCSKASVQLVHDLAAPISKGEIIGDFNYLDSSTGTIVTAKVVAGRDVAEQIDPPTLLDYFPVLRLFENKLFLALLIVLAVLIVLIVALALSRRAAKQRRRRMIYERRRQEYQRRQQAGTAQRRREPYDRPTSSRPRNSAPGRSNGGRTAPRAGLSRTAPRNGSRSGGYDRRRPR